MKKNKPPRATMPRHEAGERPQEPPSPQAIIEARRAQDAADRNPLAYALGEPLPGRSALDKLRAQQKLDAARANGESDGDDDKPIVLNNARHGRTSTITPGRFITDGRAAQHGRGSGWQ